MSTTEIARKYALNVAYARSKLFASFEARPPLVSFIIPLFNQGEFLHQAVASCALSYCGPKEILIVNDGSTDRQTYIYLDELASEFPLCKIIHQENSFLPGARNTGLRAATGEYVQFLDADDMLLPDKVTFQILQLHAHKDCGVSVAGWLYLPEDTERFSSPRGCPQAAQLTLHDFLFLWERGLSIPIHAPLFRREALQGIFFEEGLYAKEDWVFWCSLAASGCKMRVLSYPGAVYRQHAQSMMGKETEKSARSWRQATEILHARYGVEFPEFLAASEEWYQRWYVPSLAGARSL